MHAQDWFGRFVDLDLLGIASNEREYRATALTPHAPDHRYIDVMG
jgi:hypothetical protein